MTDEQIAAAVARGEILSKQLSPADLLAWSRRVAQPLRKAAINAEHATGFSAGDVSILYGVSRNAVIGYWHRSHKPARIPNIGGFVRPKFNTQSTPARLTGPDRKIGDKSPTSKGTNPAPVRHGQQRVSIPAAPLGRTEVAAAGEPVAAAFSCVGVSLHELDEDCCKFPLGPAYSTPPFRYCGEPAVERHYCLPHFVRSVDPRLREVALKRIRVPRREWAALIAQAERRAA